MGHARKTSKRAVKRRKEMTRQILNEILKLEDCTPTTWRRIRMKVIHRKRDVEEARTEGQLRCGWPPCGVLCHLCAMVTPTSLGTVPQRDAVCHHLQPAIVQHVVFGQVHISDVHVGAHARSCFAANFSKGCPRFPNTEHPARWWPRKRVKETATPATPAGARGQRGRSRLWPIRLWPNRLWPNRLWPTLKFKLYVKILGFLTLIVQVFFVCVECGEGGPPWTQEVGVRRVCSKGGGPESWGQLALTLQTPPTFHEKKIENGGRGGGRSRGGVPKSRRVWLLKGGSPKIRAFFPLPPPFSLFCLSLGVFSWIFGGV